MRVPLLALFLSAGAAAGGCAAPGPGRPVLTVDDVLRLHRAGVPANVIVARIRTSHVPARLSVEDIIALKEQGLGAEVLEALVEATAPRPEPRGAYRYGPYPWGWDPWLYRRPWDPRYPWWY